MTDISSNPRDVAIDWHIAMPSMDEERWLAFTLWLEADPANQQAYDAVARVDRRLGSIDVSRLAANDAGEPPVTRFMGLFRGKPAWIGAACAASLAALLVVGPMRMGQGGQQDATYAVATVAGTTRTVAMGDGSHVALNGETRIAFDKGNQRTARLEQGEALFTVRHDPDKPFIVNVGRFRVEDLGTVFNIVRNNGRLSVSVREGSVMFDPDGARLTLGAGDAITVDEKQGIVTRGKAVEVGGWQSGDMEFSETPLADVAAALHRRTGAQILVSAPLSRAPFTGNIRVSGDAGEDVRHLASLIGAELHRDGEKWLLSSPSDAR